MDAVAPMGCPGLTPRRHRRKGVLRPGKCRECGNAYIGHRASRAFCGDACRRAFNHRRLLRGAALYDLVMAMRFDRGRATEKRAWSLLCRMAAAFKLEDDRERDGRKSYDDVAAVLARNAHLQATVVGMNIGKVRR